jgi:Zn-dependent M28 family amino/carboxypeptidase
LLSITEQLVIQPLSHHIIILFTDAEEHGLKGSKAFINDNQTLLKSIKLNINLDMLAGSKRSKNLHYISRGLNILLPENELKKFYQQQQFQELSIVKGFRRERHALNKRTHWLLASDHGSFHQAGIPFIYFGVGTHSNYHTPNDKYSNTNHQLLINSTNSIFQQLLFLDQAI